MAQETDFFSRPTTAMPGGSIVSPVDQKNRDISSLLVLQAELKKKQDLFKKGAPSHFGPKEKADYATRMEADIAGLNREIYLKTGGKPDATAEAQDFFTKPLGVPQNIEEKAAESPYIGTPRIRSKAAIAAQQPGSSESIKTAQQREKEGTFLKNLALGGASALDTTVGSVLPMAGQVVQAGARFAGGLGGLLTGQKPLVSPERAAEIGGAVTSAVDKPFGKALGAVGQMVGSPDLSQGVQSPAYQNEASNRIMQAISQYGNQGAEVVAQKTGLPLEDVQNMMGTMAIPAGIGAGKVLGAAGRGLSDVKAQLGQQFAERQVKPVQPIEPVTQPFQSGGAAAVAHENAVKAALSEARPDLQAELAGRQPSTITPQDLKAIEIHNKFAKVDPEFVPTEGQAMQDIAKLSDEYNQKALPGNEDLRAKFEQRDPMLIKGFNNIKEQFAPEHSGVGQQGKANNILEDVKTNKVDVDNKNIKNAYDALNNADGEFVVDMQAAANDALAKIEKAKRTNRIPKEIKDTLEAYSNGTYTGTAIDFENLRTDLASDIRKAQKAGDGTQEHVLSTIRNSLEELPMKGKESIEFKEKADLARTLFKRQKDLLNPEKSTYNKLYAMAYEDNRTPAEILHGNVPHPGANKFFENFVTGSKTTPADLSRMLDLVGKDSPAHQELIAGLVDHLKQKAGVIDDKGNVSQKALRKELNNIGSRLDLIAGPEVANKLRNIGDVAELSEHVRNQGGGSANVSQTAITSEREAAQKAAKDVAMGLGEAALNFKTGGVSGIVSPVFKSMFEAKKLKQAAEAEKLAKQQKLQQSISKSAGISK